MSSGRKRKKRAPKKGTEYPAILLRSTVVFPNDVVSVQLPEDDPVLELIEGVDGELLVATVFLGQDGDPENVQQIDRICVLCRIVQHMQLPGGGIQAVFQGIARGEVHGYRRKGPNGVVRVTQFPLDEDDTPESNHRVLGLLDLVGEYLPRDGTYPDDLESIRRMNVRGPGRFADLVAAYLNLPLSVKREVAVSPHVLERLEILAAAVEGELERCSVESEVHSRVRHQIEDRQREQYLRQQLRAIRHELGEETTGDGDCDELLKRVESSGMGDEVRKVAEREIRRLRSVSSSSAEHQVIRTYVGWLLDLPWKKRTRDRLDLARARETLEENHAGLRKVKERILEHLAVRKLKKDLRGPVLCLVGPPGVGKTSLGKAVAKTLGRKFVRMSVGGLRDEAEIRGHRRTYVGAMPGKVIQLLKNAGVKNPVLQIDEIDKMGADARGDPASAILEVLDSECHGEFRDHYLDVGFDLSEVFFIVTANLLDPIPPALRDRLEIIRLSGYTCEEKATIASRHLIQRAVQNNGLCAKHVRFTPAGLV